MKARKIPGWLLGMALAGGMVASGFAREGLKLWPTATSAEQNGAAAPSAPAVSPATPTASTPAAPAAAPTAPAAAAAARTASLPPGTHVSPWLYEIERLAQAGVDEGVILAYAENSAGTFNLTADQIIYLKDLGVSTQVINTMIRHDQELLSGERPMTASAPPPPPPAVKAALAAALPARSAPATPPPPAAAPAPPRAESSIIADDDFRWRTEWILVEPDNVPEQPASAGPVRVPYPVKLNDPIIVLQLPSFSLPSW